MAGGEGRVGSVRGSLTAPVINDDKVWSCSFITQQAFNLSIGPKPAHGEEKQKKKRNQVDGLPETPELFLKIKVIKSQTTNTWSELCLCVKNCSALVLSSLRLFIVRA